MTHSSLALAPSTVEIEGEVQDVVEGVVAGVPTVVVSSTSKGQRLLTLVDAKGAKKAQRPGPAVPPNAVAFAVCGGGVVFSDDRGLVDDQGRRVADKAPLLAVADPLALFAAELCPGAPGTPGGDERVLATREGLLVVRVKDGVVVDERLLVFPAQARAYSGRGPRSLRGERPYGQALSLYAPRLFDVDVDDDGDRDLVALHEGRLAIFRRQPAGLSTSAEVRDLFALLGASADADVRVRFVSSRAHVSVSRGAVPESSRVVVVDGTRERPFSRVASTRTIEGLAVLLGARIGGPIVARIDTSLVALSGVVLTGRVAVKVIVDGAEVLSLAAAADVRGGKMDGALPIVDLDLDGDGVVDLLDLGEPGKAVLYQGVPRAMSRDRQLDVEAPDRNNPRSPRSPRSAPVVDVDGTPRAFEAATSWVIPRFTLVTPLPSSSSVALVSAPSKGKSRLTLLSR
ncbi:MAG: hypothetical protein Q8O67_33405 [Deltaproteobacteria bacterium]|nr:hypothetical protein [Deltaproteobacteria bacterium]